MNRYIILASSIFVLAGCVVQPRTTSLNTVNQQTSRNRLPGLSVFTEDRLNQLTNGANIQETVAPETKLIAVGGGKLLQKLVLVFECPEYPYLLFVKGEIEAGDGGMNGYILVEGEDYLFDPQKRKLYLLLSPSQLLSCYRVDAIRFQLKIVGYAEDLKGCSSIKKTIVVS